MCELPDRLHHATNPPLHCGSRDRYHRSRDHCTRPSLDRRGTNWPNLWMKKAEKKCACTCTRETPPAKFIEQRASERDESLADNCGRRESQTHENRCKHAKATADGSLAARSGRWLSGSRRLDARHLSHPFSSHPASLTTFRSFRCPPSTFHRVTFRRADVIIYSVYTHSLYARDSFDS